MPPVPEAAFTPDIFQYPFNDTGEIGDLPFDPEAFQIISSIEPLSVRVGMAP